MRIGLLDPRWLEQRDRSIREKQSDDEVYAPGEVEGPIHPIACLCRYRKLEVRVWEIGAANDNAKEIFIFQHTEFSLQRLVLPVDTP